MQMAPGNPVPGKLINHCESLNYQDLGKGATDLICVGVSKIDEQQYRKAHSTRTRKDRKSKKTWSSVPVKMQLSCKIFSDVTCLGWVCQKQVLRTVNLLYQGPGPGSKEERSLLKNVVQAN